MAKLTNKQLEILGIFIGSFLLSIIIGLLFAGKGRHGLGFLVGVNIGISVITLLWLGWGKDEWKKSGTVTPTPTTSAPSKSK